MVKDLKVGEVVILIIKDSNHSRYSFDKYLQVLTVAQVTGPDTFTCKRIGHLWTYHNSEVRRPTKLEKVLG